MNLNGDSWQAALLNSALDAVVIIDEFGMILDFNLAAE